MFEQNIHLFRLFFYSIYSLLNYSYLFAIVAVLVILASNLCEKKAKVTLSGNKVIWLWCFGMYTVWHNSHWWQGQNVEWRRLCQLIAPFKPCCKGKPSAFGKKKILFSFIHFHELGQQLLPHPPYSPNLTPSDYYKYKKGLTEKKLVLMISWLLKRGLLGRVRGIIFLDEIQKIEKRWTKCIKPNKISLHRKMFFVVKTRYLSYNLLLTKDLVILVVPAIEIQDLPT